MLLFCLLTALPISRADYTLIESYPHYSRAFTQGLLLHDKQLYESSGGYGKSFLIYGDLRGGHRQLALPAEYFAEGMTILNNKLFVLTWKRGTALVFDPVTLGFIERYHYPGEGWGLTDNGQELIMSDGSHELRFIDPLNFSERRRIQVTYRGKPMKLLNELEWHKGLILANQWQTNRILVIDEASGEVLKLLDLTGLYPPTVRAPGTDVLNGIAYDPDSDSWLVTGKLWPWIYRVKFDLPSPAAVRQLP
ncbi:glutamine cyclotransferase [Litorivivens lipolytica]|uniref:Glutamine cyclotransferase n=1 Tax=Litorivivens lipolytica TaxID=1524264 RepID=A0A7W4W3E7_9GAMM|nr:glutaminyl-peptide cyclotransferase [Litorivivens lipolytica]MBB3046721.1 glutamine cyclotransferase [Litorivivens lipolytica]